MFDSINNNSSIIRGLTNQEVEERINLGQVNKTKMIAGKTVWEILRTDVFSFFNILLFVIAGFVIYANAHNGSNAAQWVSSLFFVFVLFCNITIGLYQDFKAKYLMNKLKVITTPMCKVIRDGQIVVIKPSEIVLDDIIILSAGDQIPSDCVSIDKEVTVDESMLTGESLGIKKKTGDLLYSGSFITSGNCHAKVVKVGKENYIETITEKAKAFKRNPSQILRSLKFLFRVLGIMIIAIAIISIIVLVSFKVKEQGFFTENDFAKMIPSITGQMVAMIPAGLYLLTSMALATGVLSLFKKRANVQDFYSIEMLARSDVICVDKTGTITDGDLSVLRVDNVSKISDEEIGMIVHSIVKATGDDNVTAKALAEYFKRSLTFDIERVLPFSSENKYSGITSRSGTTYLVGAPEFMNLKNKSVILRQAEQYASKGYRVLALSKGQALINSDTYIHEVEIVAFIILQDHVKNDARETFAWFQNNGVQVKVISGDNALTVSEVARIAGIYDAEKCISLEGMSIEEVKAIANDYVVFGRVTPEQKEALVLALKESKHTVAMVGDGVNDMLALKRADCSIAMNSGSLSAKNVSHVVLMDDNFSTMPSVVGEGRRVINNLERTGSLFLTKTIFAITMATIFLIVSLATKGQYRYPFNTSNMVVWEVFGIGLSSFFIALEPDRKPIKPRFLLQILKKAAPFGGMMVVITSICFILFVLNNAGVYTGIVDYGFDYTLAIVPPRYGATGVAVLLFTAMSIFILFMTCRPLNLYRGIVCGTAGAISVAIVITCIVLNGKNVLDVDFSRITGENYITIAIIAVIAVAIYLLVGSVIKGLKTAKKKEETKNED